MCNRKLFICYLILLLASLSLTPQISNAEPLDNWHPRTPYPTSNSLYKIAYGNGVFVAVGDGGTIITSPDGVDWTSVNSDPDSTLFGVAYGNNTFVAVGFEGTILTSPDGWTWSLQTSGIHYDFSNVSYVNGLFIAVTGSNEILTSSDGVKWSIRTVGHTTYLSGVAYGNGIFVAVGYLEDYTNDLNSHATAFTSTDGKNWISRDLESAYPVYDVMYGNGAFVAVGFLGSIFTSPDGVTWTKIDSKVGNNLLGSNYLNGTFVVVGAGTILTSADGVTWKSNAFNNKWLSGVSFGNGSFVVVGYYGEIYTSPDGALWTGRRKEVFPPCTKIFYANGIYVVLGNYDIVTTPDFKTWTERYTANPFPIRDMAFGNSTFVAVGDFGKLLISHDAISWLESDALKKMGITYNLLVTFGQGIFVTVGQDVAGNYKILTSPDGENWTIKYSLMWVNKYIHKLMYSDGLFLIWGSEGSTPWNRLETILTSQDGDTWTQIDQATLHWIEDIAYGNGIFIAVSGYTILISQDGKNWKTIIAKTGLIVEAIGYGDGVFVATGHDNIKEIALIITSTDGVQWKARNPGINAWLSGTPIYVDRTFIISSSYGMGDWLVLQSDHLAGPKISINPALLDFDEIPVGGTVERTFSIRNEGTEDLLIEPIPDPTDPFFKVTENCTGQPLIPGEECAVALSFSPLSSGWFNSRLSIISNDRDNGPVNISLIGAAVSVSLQSPDQGKILDSCSLITGNQPTFSWTATGTFTRYSILFSTSPADFAHPIAKASATGTSNSWRPSLATWKAITKTSNNNGSIRPIYWIVVGTKADRRTVISEVRSFTIGTQQAVAINAPSDGAILNPATPPTFDFDTRCNTKFRLEISSLSDFSVPTKVKRFNFTVSHPNLVLSLQKTLSTSQWKGVKTLVGAGIGYFRIKAWDKINRETASEVISFTVH